LPPNLLFHTAEKAPLDPVVKFRFAKSFFQYWNAFGDWPLTKGIALAIVASTVGAFQSMLSVSEVVQTQLVNVGVVLSI